jgi:hypothetical protein
VSMPLQHAGLFAFRVLYAQCALTIVISCCAEANLKAAAQAAARKALANVTTVFFDDAHPPARPSVWPVSCSAHTMHQLMLCQPAATLRLVTNMVHAYRTQASQRPSVCCHQPPHLAAREPRTEQPAPAAPFRRMGRASVWWTTGAVRLAVCHWIGLPQSPFCRGRVKPSEHQQWICSMLQSRCVLRRRQQPGHAHTDAACRRTPQWSLKQCCSGARGRS